MAKTPTAIRLTALQSIVLPVVVRDDKGEPVVVTVKHKGRDQKITAHENELHLAGAVIEVDADVAKDLLAKNIARESDAILDDVSDDI